MLINRLKYPWEIDQFKESTLVSQSCVTLKKFLYVLSVEALFDVVGGP